jgi:hypothetical protein
MKKIKVSRPKPRSWSFALIVSLVLGALVLVDNGSVTRDSGLASPCRVEVVATRVNVRSAPEVGAATTAVLNRGELRGAETTVDNGYRRLVDGGWVLDDSLRPLPGSKCAPAG